MTGLFFRRITGFAVAGLAILFVSGCTPSIDGKYQDASGAMTVDIKGDKATISAPVLGSAETACKREGDKVTLTYENQPLVLTVKPDGSLENDTLKLKKKE
jgi:hypothetical protein